MKYKCVLLGGALAKIFFYTSMFLLQFNEHHHSLNLTTSNGNLTVSNLQLPLFSIYPIDKDNKQSSKDLSVLSIY